MADKKWSELDPATSVSDTDEVALRRGSGNFRWTFLTFRTWLAGFFEAAGSIAAHDGTASAHNNVEPDFRTHEADANPHFGSASTADLDAHKAAGGAEHPVATTGAAGFAPQLSGDGAEFFDGTGNWSSPSTIGEANTQSNQGGGAELGLTKTGVDLPLRTLVSGDNSVIFAPSGSTMDIRATLPTGSGTVRVVRINSGADVGDGRPRWNFIAGSDISITAVDDAGAGEVDITISATAAGQINTSDTPAAVGSNEASIDMAKVGVSLRKRKLAGDAMVGVTQGANVITFSLIDGSITNAKLAVEPAPLTHVGDGGAAHAAATTSAAGFLSVADKIKLDGVAAGAEVNAVSSVHGRTGAVVAAAGDYTAAQVTNALANNASATIQADVGFAGESLTVASGTLPSGIFTPNPLNGQHINITGTTNFIVGIMSVVGVVSVVVPQGIAVVTLDSSWRLKGTRDTGQTYQTLDLRRTGPDAVATWI